MISMLFAASAAVAQPAAQEGEALVRQFWADMKARDIEAVEAMLAPDFQSVHADGARDRAGELALIQRLDLGAYELSDFTTTASNDAMIVSYKVSTREDIDGKEQAPKAVPRLAVFQKTAAGWHMIAYANLNP